MLDKKDTKFKFIYNIYSPFKCKIIIIIVLLILISIISLAIPLCNRELMDRGLIISNYNNVLLFSILLFLIVTFICILNIIIENIRISIFKGVDENLQNTMFEKFLNIQINFFKKEDKFSSLSKVFEDINNIKTMTDASIFSSVAQLFSIIGGLCGLLMINLKMSFIIIIIICLKYFIVKHTVNRRKELQIEYLNSSWKLHSFLGESIEAITCIRLFGLSNIKKTEYKKRISKILNTESNIARNSLINTSTEQIISQLMVTTIYIVGSRLVFNIDLTIGSLTSFIVYSTIVVNPISAFINIWHHFVGIAPSISRFQDFLNNAEENNTGTLLGKHGCHTISFCDVSYKFNENSQYVLKNINFDIFPNEKVAIIGHNGCGKSTLINLLLRFYQPTDGEILIDNNNISFFDINYYRGLFSTALQDTHLFNSSIEDNIKLGMDIENHYFKHVLYSTNLEDFYNSVNNYYKIGDNGAFLSGGQQQKVALSRMLAHKRDIYVIDESTSNLDTITKSRIIGLINTILKDNIVIVITHSPTILKEVNKIILLKDGEISSIGNHEFLIQTSEYYNSLYNQYLLTTD